MGVGVHDKTNTVDIIVYHFHLQVSLGFHLMEH